MIVLLTLQEDLQTDQPIMRFRRIDEGCVAPLAVMISCVLACSDPDSKVTAVGRKFGCTSHVQHLQRATLLPSVQPCLGCSEGGESSSYRRNLHRRSYVKAPSGVENPASTASQSGRQPRKPVFASKK